MRDSMRLWIGLLSVFGVLVVMSACDSGGAQESGTVTGRWQGTVETDSVTYEVRFDLEEYGNISAELSGGPPRFDETPIALTRP